MWKWNSDYSAVDLAVWSGKVRIQKEEKEEKLLLLHDVSMEREGKDITIFLLCITKRTRFFLYFVVVYSFLVTNVAMSTNQRTFEYEFAYFNKKIPYLYEHTYFNKFVYTVPKLPCSYSVILLLHESIICDTPSALHLYTY